MKFGKIDEALTWIMQHRSDHAPFERFKEIMKELGDPQDDFKVIHVAGTNGKGSTVTYIMDILHALGYKVGTLSSPHYRTHLDRIRINGQNIDEQSFLTIVNERYDFFVANKLSMFEMDYIIMCDYFKEQGVDFVITEVGMGGRLDSTNVIDHPLLSVIVTIGHDHMKELGNTLKKVAWEKCGIIKDSSPVVIGRISGGPLKVIEEEAQRHNSPLYQIAEYQKEKAGFFIYRDQHYEIIAKADYQLHNASLALEVIEVLKSMGMIEYDLSSVKKGLRTSLWHGRFEIIGHAPLLIIDGAHNLEGAKALKQGLKPLPLKKAIIFAALKRKDYQTMLKELKGAGDICLTSFANKEVFEASVIAKEQGLKYYEDVMTAYDDLKMTYPCIVICGSLYFLSEFIALYERRYPLNGQR